MDQLKSDNSRLRDENTALLRVIAKMSKWFKFKGKRSKPAPKLCQFYQVFDLNQIKEESEIDSDWAWLSFFSSKQNNFSDSGFFPLRNLLLK